MINARTFQIFKVLYPEKLDLHAYVAASSLPHEGMSELLSNIDLHKKLFSPIISRFKLCKLIRLITIFAVCIFGWQCVIKLHGPQYYVFYILLIPVIGVVSALLHKLWHPSFNRICRHFSSVMDSLGIFDADLRSFDISMVFNEDNAHKIGHVSYLLDLIESKNLQGEFDYKDENKRSYTKATLSPHG